jgi:hypothetical protein
LPVRAAWVNKGVAPCYEDLAFEWTLRSADGTAVAATQEFPGTPTRRWMPGQPVTTGALLELPRGLAPGAYTLAVRMLRPEKPETRYYLPLTEGAEPGMYRVGEVKVVEGDEGKLSTLTWDFEDGHGAASAAAGMAAEVVGDPVHAGTKALKLAGRSEKSWNYAAIARVPVLGGARYRLSAWVLVRSTSRPDLGPSLKVGMNGADGKWITNANTGHYDTSALDTWQHLGVEFDCPVEAATGDVTVERGQLEAAIEVDLYVDDVELATIAAP